MKKIRGIVLKIAERHGIEVDKHLGFCGISTIFSKSRLVLRL